MGLAFLSPEVFSHNSSATVISNHPVAGTYDERLAMNMTPLLHRALKELESAKTRAAHDGKAAQIARQTAIAAKAKLKQARKLVKFTKKAARKAEDQAEEALEALEHAQARLEKLEKRARKKERRQKTPKKASSKKNAVARRQPRREESKPVAVQIVRKPAPIKRRKTASLRPVAPKKVQVTPDSPVESITHQTALPADAPAADTNATSDPVSS